LQASGPRLFFLFRTTLADCCVMGSKCSPRQPGVLLSSVRITPRYSRTTFVAGFDATGGRF
jgi:hypothetical protein